MHPLGVGADNINSLVHCLGSSFDGITTEICTNLVITFPLLQWLEFRNIVDITVDSETI